MKKLILLLFLFPVFLYSQNCYFHHDKKPLLEIGLGRSLFEIDTKNSTNIDLHFSFILNNFYLSFGSNFAPDFGGDETDEVKPSYDPQRIRIYSLNFSYLFKVNDMFNIGPIVGKTIGREIYLSSKNNFNSKSYYFGDDRVFYNLGILGIIQISDWNRFYFGIGTTERIKIGVTFSLINK